VDGAVRYVTKLTNALKCMKVYYTHRIPPTCFATHVAILRKGCITMDRYIRILQKFLNCTDIQY